MRKSLTTILLAAVSLAGAAASADDLFSDVSIGSPFGPSETQGAVPAQPTPTRLAGPASLSEMLKQASLNPKELDTRIVSLTLQARGTPLPVLMTFNDDHEHIRMVMVLSTLGENESPTSDQLIGMMDANRENSSVFFAYSKQQRRMELHRIVENRSLTPARLREELTAILRAADRSRELWTVTKSEEPPVAENGTTAAPQEKPAVAPATAEASPPATNSLRADLFGQWTAARSQTEAFALRLDQQGSFALVTVISGKTSQSKGKFTLEGSKLTLVDEKGTQLVGTVSLKSAKEFNFQAAGSTKPLTFKKAG